MPDEGNRLHFAVSEIHYFSFILTPACGDICDMKVLWASVNPQAFVQAPVEGPASSIILPISLRETGGGAGGRGGEESSR